MSRANHDVSRFFGEIVPIHHQQQADDDAKMNQKAKENQQRQNVHFSSNIVETNQKTDDEVDHDHRLKNDKLHQQHRTGLTSINARLHHCQQLCRLPAR